MRCSAALLLILMGSCADKAPESTDTSERTRWVAEESSARADASVQPLALPASVPLASSVAPPLSKAALAALVADANGPVTKDAFETALLAIGECVPGFTLSSSDCPQAKVLDGLRDRKAALGWRQIEIAARHLRHPSEMVRYHAATIVSREVFASSAPSGLDSEEGRAFLGALRSESAPKVASSMIRLSKHGAHRSPVLRELLRLSLRNPDSLVRMAAVDAITSPKVYAEIPDALALIVNTMTTDTDWPVRGAACAALGGADDPAALEAIRQMMETPSTPGATRGACFEGIVNTWTNSPQPARPSREGYELTMKLLTTTPRSEHAPHNRGILELSTAYGQHDAEWRDKVKDFVVVKDLRDAVESVVLDTQAGDLARDVSIFTLGMWKERALLAKLATKLAAMPDAVSKKLAVEATRESKKVD